MKKAPVCTGAYWRRRPDSDRRIKVLQTFALPLGYGATEENPPEKMER